MTRERLRLLIALVATVAVLVPLAWLWQASRMPSSYSVMDMGYVDDGGGSAMADPADMAEMPGTHHTVSVTDLVEPASRPADVSVTLTARQGQVTLASGRTIQGFTLNGSSPGPVITVMQGQLLEVHLVNESVPDGITLHWHGVDVPNAEDGVAGVTQDAVAEGETYVYRFVVPDAGTYWYHSHQVSHEQVIRGLFGALVVQPSQGIAQALDVTAVTHTYEGQRTLNGDEGVQRVEAAPGTRVRLRIVNTDNGSVSIWSDTAYEVVAVDGHDEVGPAPVTDAAMSVAPGGRLDLEVVVPPLGARIQVGIATALVVGPATVPEPAAPAQPASQLDLLSYGSPAPLLFDASHPDRQFDYEIGRRPGFVNGRPGLWWSINGHLWPNIPMFHVEEGDVVVFHLDNHSGEIHPMHLHGHHAVVLARNGVPSSGSPWWFDSLDVASGDTYDIAFVADNPGIWMDHCHNLNHAAQGLVAHLMYGGVTEPYLVGSASGNEPE